MGDGSSSGKLKKRAGSISLLFSAPAVVILVLSYIAPVALVIGSAFFKQDEMGHLSATLTLANFVQFFSDAWYVETLGRTVKIAALVAILAVLLGYTAAYFIVFRSGRWFEILIILTIAPVLVGNVVRAFGWRMLMGESGLVNGLLGLARIEAKVAFLYTQFGIVIADASNLLPLATLVVIGVLSRIDPVYLEAATVLGANPRQCFLKVTLPLSLPGIAAASVICFTLALSTFEIAVFVGGNRVQMMAPLIYDEISRSFDWPMGAAVALILLVTSLLGILLHDMLRWKGTP